jgi:hypothetical protein
MKSKVITNLDILKQIKNVDEYNLNGIGNSTDAIVIQWMVRKEMVPDPIFQLLESCGGDLDKVVLHLNLAKEINNDD